MGEVDPAFIQATEHRPKLDTIEVEGIPLIDLSVYGIRDTKELVSEIGDACEKWGFFQVINHGVPLELCTRIKKVAKLFFEQPMEEKRKVKRDEVNAMGYYDGEHTKNVRDWKEVFDFLLKDPTLVPASPELEDTEIRTVTNQWPQNPPEFREVCQEYAREVEKLGFKLLELIFLSLGLPSNRINGYLKDQNAMLRLNYYPSCPCPDLALGVGRHKDTSALTILAQDDVGGLQVKRKSDEEWIPVKPIPNALIINVGDIFQVWSNEFYESVEHRVVVNSERERFSVPLFFFPSYHFMVKPLEELVNEQNPAKYKEYYFGKFYDARKKLEVWSNDLYVSAEHRVVVNSEKERFSIPFFFFPSHYATVKPLEELVNEQNPAKYKEYNWGKYYVNRTGSNYKKLDAENVQIHHFKTSE